MEMLSKQKIKDINRLKQKKFRTEHQLFTAEGYKVVSEILSSTLSIKKIIVTNNWLQKYTNYHFNGIEPIICTNQEFNKLSSQSNPDGILAIVNIPDYSNESIPKNEWVIALNSINDPGNLGTIIRIADWFGVNHIICDQNTVDTYNPKVIQSSMGSIARVIIHRDDLLTAFEHYNGPIYGADLSGESIHDLSEPKKGILLIGNESHGIDERIRGMITNHVTIPKIGGAESLNASLACGIILSHFTR